MNKLKQELDRLKKGCGEVESVGRSPCSKHNGYCDECMDKIDQTKKCIKIFKEMVEECRNIRKEHFTAGNISRIYFNGCESIICDLKEQLDEAVENG